MYQNDSRPPADQRSVANILIRALILILCMVILFIIYPSLTGNARTFKALDNVNMRNRASMDSQIIGTLKKGARVRGVGRDGNWIKVVVGGEKSYVYSRYLKLVPNPRIYVKGDAVNLRKGPSTKSKRIALLYRGDMVKVIRKTKDWYLVKTKLYGKGYVCGRYMSKKKVKPLSKQDGSRKKRPSFRPNKNTGKGLKNAARYSAKVKKYRRAAIREAKKRLGEKYSQKKRNKKGYADCSSLVRDVFANAAGAAIGGDTTSQALIMNEYIYPISSVYDAAPGDLVYHLSANNHTGIYLGHGKVLHASQGKGKVVISSFPKDGSFWEYGCNAALFAAKH